VEARYMENWKEAKIRREQILSGGGKGVIIDSKYYPPILGKGYIHDRFSCNCGFTDRRVALASNVP
jgi:hypothetical protein